MATYKQCKVIEGEFGWVPVKSDSHGGTDLGKAFNNDIVQVIVGVAEEYGYVQVAKRFEWKTSPKNQYWIEATHLKEEIPTDSIIGKYIVEVTIRKAE